MYSEIREKQIWAGTIQERPVFEKKGSSILISNADHLKAWPSKTPGPPVQLPWSLRDTIDGKMEQWKQDCTFHRGFVPIQTGLKANGILLITFPAEENILVCNKEAG